MTEQEGLKKKKSSIKGNMAADTQGRVGGVVVGGVGVGVLAVEGLI